MYLKALLIAFAVIMVGCASTDSNTITDYKVEITSDKKTLRDGFVGKWSAEQPTKSGGKRIATVNRMIDGRYVNEFKIYDSKLNLKKAQKEFGVWGVSGGIYFTIFRGWIKNDQLEPSDPTDAYNNDSYKIIEVKADQLTYRSLATGNEFTYQRTD